MFETLFRDDAPGRGEWLVGGRTVDPAALSCPMLDIVSTSDRIVPAASAAGAGERLELGAGHVGMVIGGSAEDILWKPLAGWLSRIAAK
jgi:polyhydroxyalkanoate synthase